MSTSKEKVLSNLMWRFLERCGAQGVGFIVSIVLARLLAPEVYGVVAIVMSFIAILNVFVDSGFGNALIQKKDADSVDFSTVFYFNIVSCTAIYILLFIAAPFIAGFYGMPELTALVRVMGLQLIVSGLKNVQQAYVSRHLIFKKFFFATLTGTVGAAVIGIVLAYLGFGVWALVAQHLFNMIIDTVFLWFTVKWRPTWEFSFSRLKGLFGYGWKLLCSALLETAYNELRTLVIGKKYSSADLAFYDKGATFPRTIVTNINNSIDSVLLPTMSSEQDNRERVKAMTRRAIKTSTYIMMPMMMGLVVCGEPLVRLLLTEKWLPCVPFLRIFCFTYAFYPIHTANLNAIKALGRSDLFLKLEIMKKIIGLTAVAISMWFGVIWMAYSLVLTSILSQIINAFPNKKLLNYSYLNQLADMLPQIGLSAGMGAIVYLINFLPLPDIVKLIIQVPLGAIIYIVSSKLLKIDSFEYILSIIKGFKKKKTA